jgi:hypothetical protein
MFSELTFKIMLKAAGAVVAIWVLLSLVIIALGG